MDHYKLPIDSSFEFDASKTVSELSAKVSRCVASLREWDVLDQIGAFASLPIEQRDLVNGALRRTRDAIESWR